MRNDDERAKVAAMILNAEAKGYPADSREARLLSHARREWAAGNYMTAAADLRAITGRLPEAAP